MLTKARVEHGTSAPKGFDALTSKASLFDLWRRTNGTDAREWTWLSNQNGFRIDHAFGNETFVQLVQPSCIYDHRPREENIIDHSALMALSLPVAGLHIDLVRASGQLDNVLAMAPQGLVLSLDVIDGRQHLARESAGAANRLE